MTTFIGNYGQDVNQPINETSPFNDGQPHIAFANLPSGESKPFNLKCRIASPLDLLNVSLAVEVLRNAGWRQIDLKVLYLWGRMDRRITRDEPYTLKAVCGLLNSLKLNSISVFCPHSQATSDLLDNYVEFPSMVEDTFFDKGILHAVSNTPELAGYSLDDNVKNFVRNKSNLSLVFPDAGAAKRFAKSSLLSWYPCASVVTLHKHRDERTGKISGMKIIQGEVRDDCVIIDDLCDGGATFKGASTALREQGAKSVSLVVPHGVFSKGTAIPSIDYIFTTNSFKEWEPHVGFGVHRFI